jgi:mono/diheme cytochrome c family protein
MWPGLAIAQGDSTVTEAGLQLARKWCAECHLIESDQAVALSASAPSFQDVADDPAVTEAGLRAFFASPHENMPDIMLSNQETDEIIAYILSLRGQ